MAEQIKVGDTLWRVPPYGPVKPVAHEVVKVGRKYAHLKYGEKACIDDIDKVRTVAGFYTTLESYRQSIEAHTWTASLRCGMGYYHFTREQCEAAAEALGITLDVEASDG